MADVKKFKFVSPGIFLSEVDNSQIPRLPDDIGPVIIGRAERGPNMRPVQVDSFAEFIETFGYPMPGNGTTDTWRDGNYSSATHGSYAAQAYLKNSSPITFIKLAGVDHADSVAGKAGWSVPALSSTMSAGSSPGAYALYVAPSASSDLQFVHAATFYVERGSLGLWGSGTPTTADGSVLGATSGSMNMVMKSNSGAQFTVRHFDENQANGSTATKETEGASNGKTQDYTLSFSENDSTFIRDVFPTDPASTNSNFVDSSSTAYKDFWLGETYEGSVQDHVGASISDSSQGACLAVLVPFASTANEGGDWKKVHTPPATGWVFSQNQGAYADLDITGTAVLDGSTNLPVTNLFKIHSLYGGEWEQKNIKVSIKDIKKSTNQFDKYGSFTVEVRRASDDDNSPQLLEQYSNCNLNPSSPNYIAVKIGDKFTDWDSTERRYKEYNNNNNMSRFIRVQMNQEVDAGQTEATLLPFGFYGPTKVATETLETRVDGSVNSMIRTNKAANKLTGVSGFVMGSTTTSGISGSFIEPSMRLRADTAGLSDATKAYFGVDTRRSGSSAYDASYEDLTRALPGDLNVHDTLNNKVYSFIFTLDDVTADGSAATYVAGAHQAGTSTSAVGTYDSILANDFNRFTLPLVGGFDGVDVTAKNPFNNSQMGNTETTDYAYNSVKRAIDAVSDAEVVECNLMAIPGIYKAGLTKHLVDTCEARADALAIIDLENDFKDSSENTAAENDDTRKADVSQAVSSLRARAMNSSYGATYFPWCTIRDDNSGALVPVPPSVIAMGVMSYGQSKSELWFAPAGFTRGGLSENQAAGLPVVGVKHVLSSKDRDKLYDANINPIATFPNEGIVVFGQKTLQVTQSALDRINVRRLLIYLKKEISRMSATLLFDQNVDATWKRFLAKVNPFLGSVKTRFGLTEFKVVLDSTTTTPELIDRNVMYAKIFLKPARAIEFIALDFVITDSGASFEDL